MAAKNFFSIPEFLSLGYFNGISPVLSLNRVTDFIPYYEVFLRHEDYFYRKDKIPDYPIIVNKTSICDL